MKKKMRSGDKKVLLMLLGKMRLQYQKYVEEDDEVIDAIHLLQEEINYNIEDEEE